MLNFIIEFQEPYVSCRFKHSLDSSGLSHWSQLFESVQPTMTVGVEGGVVHAMKSIMDTNRSYLPRYTILNPLSTPCVSRPKPPLYHYTLNSSPHLRPKS